MHAARLVVYYMLCIIHSQLTFGFIADRVGRRVSFIITLSLLTFASFASSLAFSTPVSSTLSCLVFTRLILGIAIGGEYPLSATISSETAAQSSSRGRNIASVFAMQSFGVVLAPIVVLLLLVCARASSSLPSLDLIWRLALGFGCIPGLIMLVFRCRMKETKVFLQHKQHEKQQQMEQHQEEDVELQQQHSHEHPRKDSLSAPLSLRMPTSSSITVGSSTFSSSSSSSDSSSSDSSSSSSSSAASPALRNPRDGFFHHHHASVAPASSSSSSTPSDASPSTSTRLALIRTAFFLHRRAVIATAVNWCLFDIIFYANSMFSATIISEQLTERNTVITNVNGTMVITAVDTTKMQPAEMYSYVQETTTYTLYLALTAL